MRVGNTTVWLGLLYGLCGFWSGCFHRGNPPLHTSATAMAPGNKTPFNDSAWKAGPAILPRATLLAALAEKPPSGKTRLWRLPIVIELEATGLRQIKLAYIGTDTTLSKEDRITVQLQDLFLGVSLDDRIRQHCPHQSTCRLWVAGTWGTTWPSHEPTLAEPYPFALRAVIGPQQDTPASTLVRYRDE